MNASRTRKPGRSSIIKLDTTRQASLSILLITVIPSLVSFFSGHYMATESASVPYAALLGILAVILMAAGYRILKKYPDNIIEIRKFVTEITEGYLPDHLTLQRAYESDDLTFIEKSLNSMLLEMKKKQQLRMEEQRHRTIVESVGILVERIYRPLDIIQQSLVHLNLIAPMEEERADITRCQKELDRIKKNIKKVMGSKELKSSRTYLETPPPAVAKDAPPSNTSDMTSSRESAPVYFESRSGSNLAAA